MLALLILSCSDPDVPPEPVGDTATATETEPPLQPLFSFVIVADPHVSRPGENADRLEQAVAWINREASARALELVFVVGDIGWSDEGLALSKELLDELTIPYLPILGDNEVHFGSEQAFDTIFAAHYAELASMLPDFARGPVETHNPEWDQTSWFQNFSFTYGGVRFLGLDWCSRDPHDLLSEFAALHDFSGGTWDWFEGELSDLEPSDAGDVLLFSHHPMHLGLFDLAQLEQIAGVTLPIEGRVAAAFAGHMHTSYEAAVDEAGYEVFVTDATWDDENTLRIVGVHGNGQRFAYTQELVVVPLLPY